MATSLRSTLRRIMIAAVTATLVLFAMPPAGASHAQGGAQIGGDGSRLYPSSLDTPEVVPVWSPVISGPDQTAAYGDPFTPVTSPDWAERRGVYTYAIRLPAEYPFDRVRVELFDPEMYNNTATGATVYGADGTTAVGACFGGNIRSTMCSLSTP